ncbi:hypothetical protein MtrunA17_Chr8g0370841 [Medicago truncatula]|uniref:Uncharacterized protein n=1 Tax=Medicago truncatula TaxID=3880 RepID=A0A396GLI5_MEDTR|nr:hypothetical protein MtrunA17_Chr8g0370841 [Medicago truncatula]
MCCKTEYHLLPAPLSVETKFMAVNGLASWPCNASLEACKNLMVRDSISR